MKKKLILMICVIGLTLFTACGSDVNSVKTSNAPSPTSADDNTSSTPTVGQSTEESQTGETTPADTKETENKEIAGGAHDIAGATFYFSGSVRNDVTGKWRISTVNTSMSTEEYAAEFYKELFSSDDEIHGVVNFALKTTSRITVLDSETLDVTIMEYVDGEEHDAKELFSGMVLANYFVNIDDGTAENLAGEETVSSAEPQQASTPETVSPDANATVQEPVAAAQSSEPEPAPNTTNQGGNGENFNTYDNQEQQNTTELVLNKGSMKIHNPWCNAVSKISPENYETTTLSVAELEAQGYVKCKQKGDW